MRKYYILSVLTILMACNTIPKPSFQTVPDSQTKILKGIINSSILKNDTAFNWFVQNQQYGAANKETIAILQQHTNDIQFIVFGGTWCEDSQNLLPVFYRLLQKSHFPEKQVVLYAVDRQKTTIQNKHIQYNIKNVPTFIVLKNHQEIGRIVEYGTIGSIDKEIGQIIEAAYKP